jgi:uncharacterized membrane protein
MSGFAVLVVAIVIWLGLHIVVSGTRLRDRVVAETGEARFRAAFAIASIGALALLIIGFRSAPAVQLWQIPAPLGWLLVVLMLPAFCLFVGSVATRNPTMVGGAAGVAGAPRGIVRVTRHPMLWSFAIWGLVHVIGPGDVASVLFFGTFLVTALAGMPSIDAKLARRDPAGWRRFAAVTSILPGGAIAAGRNRLVVEEIGWIVPLIGVAAWAVLLWLHPTLFGVPPVPG